MRINKIVGGAAVAAIVAATALVAGAQGSSTAGSQTQPASGSSAGYMVLSRPATAQDSEYVRASTILRTTASRAPDLGLDPGGARVLRSDHSQTLAVVPAKAAPCLVSGNGGPGSHISCGTGSQPVTATVSYGSAVGVVPDSVGTVSFKMTDGTVATRDVVDNLWDAPAEAKTASFAVDGRSVTVELMPLSARPDDASTGADGMTSIGQPDPSYRG